MLITFLLVDERSPNFLLNLLVIAVDQVCFQFSISLLVLELFAVKVKSFFKSRQILDVFALLNFKGQCLTKIVHK